MLRVLSAQFDGGAMGAVPCFVHQHHPLSTRLRIEAASRDDETALWFAKFYLKTQGLARKKQTETLQTLPLPLKTASLQTLPLPLPVREGSR